MTDTRIHTKDQDCETTEDRADVRATVPAIPVSASPMRRPPKKKTLHIAAGSREMTQEGTIKWTTTNGIRWEKHPGFLLFRKNEGKWFIRKRIDGQSFHISTGCHALNAAIERYVRFEANPYEYYGHLRRSRNNPNRYKKPSRYNKVVADYLRHLRNSGAVKRTLQNNNLTLTKMGNIIGDGHIIMVTPHDVMQYLDEAVGDLHTNTRRLHFKILDTFFRWCVNHDLIAKNPCDNIKAPRAVPAHVDRRRVVEAEELKAVVRETGAEWTKHCLVVLWALGLRRGEVFRIRVPDIKVEDRELFVRSVKARPARWVPIPDDSVLASCLYMAGVNAYEHQKADTNLGINIDRACDRSGIDRFTPKALRHSRITLWLREGCNAVDVMRWAGHTDLKTTMTYIQETRRTVQMPKPTGLGLVAFGKEESAEDAQPEGHDGARDR